MAQPYLDQLQTLVSEFASSHQELVCKHFFSGAALYCNGLICASLTPKGLAFKLPSARCEELIANGEAEALRYFDNSPIKKGYILLPEYRALGAVELLAYLKHCTAHVDSADT